MIETMGWLMVLVSFFGALYSMTAAIYSVIAAAPKYLCHYIPVTYMNNQWCEWTQWSHRDNAVAWALIYVTLAYFFVAVAVFLMEELSGRLRQIR